jgi:D-alanyl-D-alanine carboxypeptidase
MRKSDSDRLVARRLLCSVVLLGLFCSSACRQDQPFTGQEQDENNRYASEIDKILSGAFKTDEPGAAVIAVKNGQVVFRKGYGMAEMELGTPIQPEMVFKIGSITKQISATAILMLAERGELSIDDEITKYFPDFPMEGERVTIKHLLSHSSGLPDYWRMDEFDRLIEREYFRMVTGSFEASEIINVFTSKSLEFRPGDQFQYCNSGYFLLGLTIEKVSGATYGEFLKENIFDPLGMDHTCYGDNTELVRGRVQGYVKKDDRFVNNPHRCLDNILEFAAGGLMSNVDDLAKWDESLYTEKLVSSKALEEMFTANMLNNGEPSRYAFGWFVTDCCDLEAFCHAGEVTGFRSFVIRVPEAHVYIAILGNNGSYGANVLERLARRIGAVIID